jgi:hypothetical protein
LERRYFIAVAYSAPRSSAARAAASVAAPTKAIGASTAMRQTGAAGEGEVYTSIANPDDSVEFQEVTRIGSIKC